MSEEYKIDRVVVAMAIKLVQPGQLKDVLEGLIRLTPSTIHDQVSRAKVSDIIGRLREKGLVRIYHGQRYILTSFGEQLVMATKMRHQIEARRLYLLKETRRSID